jgi:uncharacterized alkaline shock family protein YloU
VTALARPGAGVGHAPPDGADAGERGRTELANRVVEKIAAQAVTEVDQARGLPAGRLRGLMPGEQTERAQAEADVDGRLVLLTVRLTVTYPAPVRTTTRAVRAHVTARVEQLCDVTVRQLDIRVIALRTDPVPARRVL